MYYFHNYAGRVAIVTGGAGIGAVSDAASYMSGQTLAVAGGPHMGGIPDA